MSKIDLNELYLGEGKIKPLKEHLEDWKDVFPNLIEKMDENGVIVDACVVDGFDGILAQYDVKLTPIGVEP